MLAQQLPPVRIALIWVGIAILVGLLWRTADAAAIGLLGTVVGALLTFAVAYTNEWRRDSKQVRVAQMSLANDLRHWLSAVLDTVYDVRNHESTDGCGGSLHTELPALAFEADLTNVAVLDTSTSKELFELIHAKASANGEISSTLQFVDDDDAIDVFRGRSAELFLTTLALYKDMCKRVGWSDDAFSARAETMMREEIGRYEKLMIERTESNKEMCAEMDKPSDQTMVLEATR